MDKVQNSWYCLPDWVKRENWFEKLLVLLVFAINVHFKFTLKSYPEVGRYEYLFYSTFSSIFFRIEKKKRFENFLHLIYLVYYILHNRNFFKNVWSWIKINYILTIILIHFKYFWGTQRFFILVFDWWNSIKILLLTY